MPVADHIVSFRNGLQIMVRGLALAQRLGYCRDAWVQVTDPSDNPDHEPWVFIVPNDEHATLSCTNPPPPDWIQPGVAIRIEVEPPLEAADALLPVVTPTTPTTAPDAGPAIPTMPALDLPPHIVYAIDVGAPGGGLAWARLKPSEEQTPCGSMNFDHFLDLLIQDLRSNLPVALGLEAPLFVPVAREFRDLTRARTHEPSAWSFRAGAYVTAVALPLMGYVLRHIGEHLEPVPRITLDPADWMTPIVPGADGSHLHVWEAFVWGRGHARTVNAAGLETHVQDAGTAVLAFARWEKTQPRPNSDVTTRNPFSTIGAAVLWSGLSTDVRLLHQEVLVLRPLEVLAAGITAYEPPAASGT